MAVVIAIDAGTTGVRCLALREDATPAGYAYAEFAQHFPRPGWVEHDPAEIWAAATATLAELVAPRRRAGRRRRHHQPARDDRGVGPATGQPLHRAIVWQDRRTAARCDELREAGHLDLVRPRPGWSSTPTSRPPSSSGC